MTTQTKFRAVGAVITKYLDRDACRVAAVLKVSQLLALSDESRWLTLDFNRTPSRASKWSEVWFDDRGVQADGTPAPTELSPLTLTCFAATSIGPLLNLPRGQYLGAVYIADAKFQEWWPMIKDPRIDPSKPETPWKPKGWFHYELTTVAEEGDSGGKRRYAGFEARVESLVDATKAKVSFFSPSDRATPLVTEELDFADPGQCAPDIAPDPIDPAQPGKLEDMLRREVGARGGIYLNLRFAAAIADPSGQSILRGPKLPIGMGF